MPPTIPDFSQSINTTPGAGALDVVNAQQNAGVNKESAQNIVRGIPGHNTWSVVGDTPTKDAQGNYTWSISSPNGESDSVTMSKDGKIVAAPQKTPTETKKDFTIIGPDVDGKYTKIFNDGKTPNEVIQGVNGGKTKKDFTIQNDSNGQPWVYFNDDPQHPVSVSGPATKSTMTEYEKETAALAREKFIADENARKTTDAARERGLDIDKQLADIRAHESDATIAAQKSNELHQQAQDLLAAANNALNAQRIANDAWYQHQQAAATNRSGDIEQQRVTQEGANQAATQTLGAANALETGRHNAAAEASQRAQVGADTLNQRATHATGLLNNWVNAAAGNKNFGLGKADISGLGPGLMSDAGGFATQMMGGQSTIDDAAKMVHAANPDLAASPSGAAYTSILQQMLERYSGANNATANTNQQQQTSIPNKVVAGTPDPNAMVQNPSLNIGGGVDPRLAYIPNFGMAGQ